MHMQYSGNQGLFCLEFELYEVVCKMLKVEE